MVSEINAYWHLNPSVSIGLNFKVHMFPQDFLFKFVNVIWRKSVRFKKIYKQYDHSKKSGLTSLIVLSKLF